MFCDIKTCGFAQEAPENDGDLGWAVDTAAGGVARFTRHGKQHHGWLQHVATIFPHFVQTFVAWISYDFLCPVDFEQR